MTVTLSAPTGALAASSGGGVTVSGGANALVLSGSIANINTFIAGGAVTYSAAAPAGSEVTLTVLISDDGNTGSGGAQSDSKGVILEVADVNDAPVLDASASPALTGISEDAGAPTNGSVAGSTLVSALLGGATDADAGAQSGVAIQGVSASGQLWYSLDGGANWTAASTPSATAALLLPSDARIYFRPDADANGSIADALTFRAWDQTSGAAGGTADVTVNGGTTAFSVAADTAQVSVASVNDAPEITAPGALSVTPGTPTILTGFSFADVDAGGGAVQLTLAAPQGALSAASGGGVTVGGTPSALTLTGTLADLNAFFAAAKVSYLAASGATGDVTLTATLSDQGNVGSGGALQDVATVTLDLPEASPPPSNEQVVIVGGLPVTVRENVGPGGGVERVAEVPPPTNPITANMGAMVALRNLEQVTLGLGAGSATKVKAPVNIPPQEEALRAMLRELGLSEAAIDAMLGKGPDGATGKAPGAVLQIGSAVDGAAYWNINVSGKPAPEPGSPILVVIDSGKQGPPDLAQIIIDNIDVAYIQGSAFIRGGAGPQVLFGDEASQSVILGEGDDELHGGDGSDTVGSTTGDDTLFGDGGDDQVFGGEDDDALFGGSENDHLQGNTGQDTLNGNAGADTVHGGQGDDVARGGQDGDVVSGDLGDDLLFGDLGDDNLRGGDGNDFAQGNLGDDTVAGGAGDDILQGGQGQDLLRGGDGADTLLGDRGDDTLAGEAGADRFIVFADGGRDVITDFDAAAGDRLEVRDGLSWTLHQAGADAVADFGGGQQVLLAGVDLALLPQGWILAG